MLYYCIDVRLTEYASEIVWTTLNVLIIICKFMNAKRCIQLISLLTTSCITILEIKKYEHVTPVQVICNMASFREK